MNKTVHRFPARQINGKETSLQGFAGKVLLIVNVASKCGLTPQYEGLEKTYEKYKSQGLEVLGFPSNEFAGQEPGTNAEIMEFCQGTFGVKFPMFEKTMVKGGPDQNPLYKFLTEQQPTATSPNGRALEDKLIAYGSPRKLPTDVLWNFEKFLVNRKGEVVGRFNPDVTPDSPTITQAIEAALQS